MMSALFTKLKRGLSLLSSGQLVGFLYRARIQAWSEETIYILRRNLTSPVIPPPASLPISVRLFEKDDGKHFIGPESLWRKLTGVRVDQLSREKCIKAHIPLCYVAVTGDNTPCFIQWLFAPSTNDRTDALRKKYFPPLSGDEVLMEGAFVPPRYRGKRIMACAMSQVAEKGAATGARWAITYVEDWNIASLRGCLACGFRPYILKRVTWRMFREETSVAVIEEKERRILEALWQEAPVPDRSRNRW